LDDPKLNEHTEFVAAYPFFGNFSVLDLKNGDGRPVYDLSINGVSPDSALPLSALDGSVAQPGDDAISLAYEIVDRGLEIAVFISNACDDTSNTLQPL
jgi:hypothetical protein